MRYKKKMREEMYRLRGETEQRRKKKREGWKRVIRRLKKEKKKRRRYWVIRECGKECGS